MTTRTIAPVLPLEARRVIWDRLWRDVLLRPRPLPPPPPPPPPPADPDEDEGEPRDAA